MFVMKNTKKFLSPPYASVNKTSDLFDLLSTHNFSSLTASDLKQRGFSTADAFQVIASLKFLGFLNEDNTKTDKLSKIQLRGDQKTAAIKDIVTKAYSALFSVAPEANKLSRDDLHNEFMAVYDTSPRVAQTAVPLFLWLCKQAGLEVTEEVNLKDRFTKNKVGARRQSIYKQKTVGVNIQTQARKNSSFFQDNEAFHVYLIGKIRLLIPAEEKLINYVMDGGLKCVKIEIEKFIKHAEGISEKSPDGKGSLAAD